MQTQSLQSPTDAVVRSPKWRRRAALALDGFLVFWKGMEKLLLAGILVNDDAMQALAFQRGVAVKEYLATKDLPPERLFLGASNSGKVDAKADVKPDAKWVPRADLNIAM